MIKILKKTKAVSNSGKEIEFDDKILDDIVQNYDAFENPAPVVFGHPKDNEPAKGWVSELKRIGNDIYAKLRDVSGDLRDGVKNGAFKKISPSLFPPEHPANPKKGSYYLRHVGFLGASAPAIPMGTVKAEDLSADNEYVFAEFSISNDEDLEVNLKDKESEKNTVKDTIDFAEFNALKEKLEAVEAEKRAIETKAKKDEIANFTAELVKDGNILPAHKESVEKILSFCTGIETIDFAEGETIESLVKGYFKSVKAFDFSEKSKVDDDDVNVDFTAPKGVGVDKDGLELLQKAEKLAKEQNIKLEEALLRV